MFATTNIIVCHRNGQETKIRVCRFGMGCSFGFSFGSGNSHSMTNISPGPSNCILMHVNKDTYHNIWTSTADANKSAFFNQSICNQQQNAHSINHQQQYQNTTAAIPNQDKCSSTSLFVLKDLKVSKNRAIHVECDAKLRFFEIR